MLNKKTKKKKRARWIIKWSQESKLPWQYGLKFHQFKARKEKQIVQINLWWKMKWINEHIGAQESFFKQVLFLFIAYMDKAGAPLVIWCTSWLPLSA